MSTRTPTHDFTQADVDAIVARTPMSARETGRPAWGGWGGCWRRWASARLSLHGVDTLLHVLFFCLVFMPSAGRWSLDARAGRVSTGPTSGARVALRTLQLHLCFISLDTGLAKAQGVQWWNGEALWRALMQPRFQAFDFSWLASYPLLAKVGCWSTLLLHAGIAVCLRLWLFSLMMTAFNLAAFAWTWRASEPPVKPGRPPRIQGREPEPKEGVAHEDSPLNPTPIVAWRPAVEQRALSTPGVRGIVVRPGVVYGQGTGIPAMLGASVKDGGAVRYVGTGENPWAVVFVDALALDQRFTPEKAQKLLGWAPRGPAFLDELRTGSYARR